MEYVRENPVRGGFVAEWHEKPRDGEHDYRERRENDANICHYAIHRDQRERAKSGRCRFKARHDGERNNRSRSYPRQPSRCDRRAGGPKSKEEVKTFLCDKFQSFCRASVSDASLIDLTLGTNALQLTAVDVARLPF